MAMVAIGQARDGRARETQMVFVMLQVDIDRVGVINVSYEARAPALFTMHREPQQGTKHPCDHHRPGTVRLTPTIVL